MSDESRPATLNELKGCKPVGLWVGPVERELRLRLEDGRVFSLHTSGDCCSESWWADAFGVRGLYWGKGHPIESAEEIDMPKPEDDRTRQEFDEAYGVRLRIAGGGVCDLIFRNSSNGYYGGWASYAWVDDVPDDWQQIERDWRA